MSIDSHQLLRRLEPVVRPCATSVIAESPSFETAAFDARLAKAERGEFASGSPIDQSMLASPLGGDFADRLSHVADAAEVAGFTRVVVAAGERSVVLQVSERRLDCELSPGDKESFHRVDAAVRLLSDQDITANRSRIAQLNQQPPAAICEAILSIEPSTQSSSRTRGDEAA